MEVRLGLPFMVDLHSQGGGGGRRGRKVLRLASPMVLRLGLHGTVELRRLLGDGERRSKQAER